jgi:hypothetical protein
LNGIQDANFAAMPLDGSSLEPSGSSVALSGELMASLSFPQCFQSSGTKRTTRAPAPQELEAFRGLGADIVIVTTRCAGHANLDKESSKHLSLRDR